MAPERSPLPNNIQLQCLGDHALLFSLPSSIDPSTLHEIFQLSEFIRSLKIDCIKDVIPSYHTVTIIYEIEKLYNTTINQKNINHPLQLGYEIVELFSRIDKKDSIEIFQNKIIKIPVCYDLTLGIDLKNISIEKKVSIEEIIKLHSTTIYTVYCLGFLPGFAYMGSVHKNIQTPRHSKPRAQVFAGSVGIAGEQTGIYPMNSPGGWQIIGRTPIKIFNENASILATLKMGNQVEFYPISLEAFNETNEHAITI